MATTPLASEDLRRRLEADLAWIKCSKHLIGAEVWQDNGGHLASCAHWTFDFTLNDVSKFDNGSRLGHHFERLHALALNAQHSLKVIALNRALKAQGQTLGELDCLYSTAGGEVVHREVAVKFYLGRNNSPASHNWVGPGKVDHLDRKLVRMLTHQLSLSTLAAKFEAWPNDLPFPTRREAFVLGAFLKHPDHEAWPEVMHKHAETGFWCTSQELESLSKGPWGVLKKPWWLNPCHAGRQPWLDSGEVARWVEQHQRPVFVGLLDEPRAVQNGCCRGFVVPVGWNDEH